MKVIPIKKEEDFDVKILEYESYSYKLQKSQCRMCKNFFIRKFKTYKNAKIKKRGGIYFYKRILIPIESRKCSECKDRLFFNLTKNP
ncbi:MAG: hypothetical protein ACQESA_00975 [Patescibacteria group bacterium]